jgi:peptide/nickel transport system permease protein
MMLFETRLLKKLKKHPLAIIGIVILCFFYLIMIFAEFIAPYDFDNGKRDYSYAPPTKIHFFHENKFTFPPVIYPYSYTFNQYAERIYLEDISKPYKLSIFTKGDRVKLFGIIPINRHLFGVKGNPDNCRLYLLGSDAVGRDLFSRIVYGSRVSLTIGFLGVAITFLLGFLVGGISGYYGGKIDSVLMRFAECFMLVPSFFLLLALRSAFPPKLSSIQVYFLIIIILSFIEWAGFARIIRGMSLTITKQDFVKAAKSIGASDLRIIILHILPQTLSYAIVAATLSIPHYILGESALSLIGLGIQEPQASWGNLLSVAMNVSDIQYHPWILIPGIFIFLTVMAFNFLGDALRDAADPNK